MGSRSDEVEDIRREIEGYSGNGSQRSLRPRSLGIVALR
jgi:hypothetical protein